VLGDKAYSSRKIRAERQGTGDDTGVVAEQQPTQRRDQGEFEQKAALAGRLGRLGRSRLKRAIRTASLY
jgi:hypothetical protein